MQVLSKRERGAVRETVEVVGIVAVVLSLLLVAYEVRQSNRIAQATTTYEIGRDVNDFNVLGYSDPNFAAFLLKLRNPEFDATPVEALQTRLIANRFVNLWTIQEKAYRNGLLTDTQFALTRADVVTVMTVFPALKKPWRDMLRDEPRLLDYEVLAPLREELRDGD